MDLGFEVQVLRMRVSGMRDAKFDTYALIWHVANDWVYSRRVVPSEWSNALTNKL